jgi:hypothetical protein
MCRNILPLRRKDAPVHRADIEASALQYVRKIVAINSPIARQRVVPAEELEAKLAVITQAAVDLLAAAGCEITDESPPDVPAAIRLRKTAGTRTRGTQTTG